MNLRRQLPLLLSICLVPCAITAQPNSVNVQHGSAVSQILVNPGESRWVPGQIIVKYRSSSTTGSARLRSMGYTGETQELGGGEYVYSLPTDQIRTLSDQEVADMTEAAVDEMKRQPDVEYAQYNYILQIVRVPEDPLFELQWHYRNNGSANDEAPGGVNLPRAWERTTGASSAVIAVIDTGILPNHPDIDGSPNLLPGFDMITDTFTSNDGDGRDPDATDPGDGVDAGDCGFGTPALPDSWHGTHVAGTVGVGRTDNDEGVAGVNWSSRVVPLRALGRCGGSTADINDSIRWAAGLPVPGAAANANPAKVINMSLGASAPCSASPSTQAAINDAVAAGVTVVVAAGNEAQNASNTFPAGCDNVIAVAASDFNGDLVTRYSNFGPAVDILAPGGDTSADEDNDGNPDGVLSMVEGGYAFFNGTSMASPHVAGVAGLLLAQDPTLSPQQIEDLLESNAILRNSSQCPRACGAGLLNADIDVGATPPPAPLRIAVDPTDFRLDEGDSETLRVTLTRGGAAVAGETVAFSSRDAQVATISPATATSDASGNAQATVTAVERGNTSFVVSVQGQSQTAPVNVAIRVVPGVGLVALLILTFLVGFVGFRRLDRNRSAEPAT